MPKLNPGKKKNRLQLYTPPNSVTPSSSPHTSLAEFPTISNAGRRAHEVFTSTLVDRPAQAILDDSPSESVDPPLSADLQEPGGIQIKKKAKRYLNSVCILCCTFHQLIQNWV